MYLRRSARTKNGKEHTYWRLVRSVRRHGKVVQETVAQLGELDAEGRTHAKALARAITGGDVQSNLFEARPARAARGTVRVGPGGPEGSRNSGNGWPGRARWRALRVGALWA